MIYKIPFTGDIHSEFSHLILAALVIAVLSLAWWTTNIRDNWQVRAVYFLDTRLRRSRSRHLQRLTNHTVSSTLVESTQSTTDTTSSQPDPVSEVVDAVNSTAEEDKPEETESGEASNLETKDGPAAIIKKMDADNDLVREKRLEFFNKRRNTIIDSSEGASSSSGECSAHPTVVPDSEEGDAPKIIECSVESDGKPGASDDSDNADSIRIKLKYLNDDLKIVDGQLTEMLGEFKRRHFETEISENKLVKLIFNGQLLQRDDDSLQSYGFFNDCVVHCLIHQQRIRDDGVDAGNTNNTRSTNGRSNQRDWDLGNLFTFLISAFLTSAWYFRYQCPQFFTITATIALLLITGLFVVFSLGWLFAETEVRRPEAHIIH